jgi:hypothetical protein
MAEMIPISPERSLATGYCPDCGYDLRGNTGQCAECGLSLASIAAGPSRLPWAGASGLRELPAYLRTVLNVLTRTKLVCREILRDIDAAAARRFRRVTVAVFALSVCGVLAAALLLPPPPALTAARMRGHPARLVVEALAGHIGGWGVGLGVAGLAIGIVCSTALVTAAPIRFFYEDRGAALSRYACAALALFPLLAALGALLLPLQAPDQRLPVLGWIFSGAIVISFAAYWLVLWSIAVRVLRRPRFVWRAVLLTPALWLIIGPLGLIVPVFMVLFLVVVLYCLTWLLRG